MKFLKLGIILFFGLVVLFSMTSTDEANIIYWQEGQTLSWDDFEGEPRFFQKNVSALTSSGIVHYKGCKNGMINYKVEAYFEKNESWVKDEARTAHHLRHEQLHFDITELYARKLRKLLTEKKFKCGQEQAFETFVDDYLQNWEVEQHSFDLYTKHSIDEEQQWEWYYKIANELEQYNDYK